MDAILGLVSGSTFNDESWNTRTTRRKIAHDYPNGEFPLTALLSMMETDWTDSAEFGHYEKVWAEPDSAIATFDPGGGGSALPFTATGGWVSKGATFNVAVGDVIRIKVDDKTQFHVHDQIFIELVPLNAGGTVDLQLIVTEILSSAQAIEARAIMAATAVVNSTNAYDATPTAGPVDAPMSVIGSAMAEGTGTRSGIIIPPFKVENFTQIFKDGFSITGTAGTTPTDWDKTGSYREAANDNLLKHMTNLEKAFIFGTKSVEYDMVDDDGEIVPRRTTGGVIWHLQQYEAANAPWRGGTGAPALTANTDDEKRIINGNGATGLTWEFFAHVFLERLFRVTHNKAYEKICVCGSGFIGAINAFFENNRLTTYKNMKAETVYGMNIHTWESPFGVVHFKTHPLFNRVARRRYDALFLDVNQMKYRPKRNRDTRRYKNLQGNAQDKRKDQWLTEAGLEMWFPQSCAYVRNMQKITAE